MWFKAHFKFDLSQFQAVKIHEYIPNFLSWLFQIFSWLYMEFIFHGNHIDANANLLKVECVMDANILVFYGFGDWNDYEDWNSHLEYFF